MRIRLTAGLALLAALVGVALAITHGGSSTNSPPPVSFPTGTTRIPSRDKTLTQPWLTIRNGRFADASGSPVVLRGYDVAVGTDAYQQAQALGANFVRIYIAWSQVEPTAPTGPGDTVHHWDETLLGQLDTEVAYLERQHVNVLIDFHQFHWSPWYAAAECKPNTPCNASGIPAWYYQGRYGQDRASEARAKAAFWTTDERSSVFLYGAFAEMMARRYGHYPNVLGYEVFNEPHAGLLGDGTSATNAMLAWQARIVHILHGVDPSRTAVVMCRGGGEGVGTANLGLLGNLGHVALDFHDYFNGKPGTGLDASGDNWTPSWRATHNQVTGGAYTGTEQAQAAVLAVPIARARHWGVPLLVGEWGIHSGTPGADEYQRQMLELFARDGVSWARWNLGSGGGFALLNQLGTPSAEAEQLKQAIES